MKTYADDLIQKVRDLRSLGKTYAEINADLGLTIPKSSLSYMCKAVDPGEVYRERILKDARERLVKLRKLAVTRNKEIFDKKLELIRSNNLHLANLVMDEDVGKIALAMLYLGEGGKWKSHRGLHLGSSDPKILNTYINLLIECYDIERDSLRCKLHHRADQDAKKLLTYWSRALNIPKEHFYISYMDKRTIGKPTLKKEYKGTCSVYRRGTHIQLELESIADIISGAWGIGAVG